MKNKKIIFIAGLLLALRLGAFPALAAGPGDLLVPVGETVGIDLTCRGAMVSGFAEVHAGPAAVCPARDAGILPGDRITALDGVPVADGQAFLDAAERFDGRDVTLTVCRDGRETDVTVCPARNEQGRWQLGLWLRDSVRGVGTVTFYDPASGTYGALGHGVGVPDSRELLPIAGGSITAAAVADVVPGKAGEPGELCGMPEGDRTLGTVERNTPQGIFGRWTAPTEPRLALPAASDAEIRTGPATILSTVDGTGPRQFAAEILRIDRSDGTRQLTVAVTDPELLALTGGIVQGMSGSPILQNGRLVGAVTHVLVSDPTKGYGISAENMLKAAEQIRSAA